MTLLSTERKAIMTNYEYIKSMNIDEMASLLVCIEKDWDNMSIRIDDCLLHDDMSSVKDWLEEECIDH